jgi:pectinesterase
MNFKNLPFVLILLCVNIPAFNQDYKTEMTVALDGTGDFTSIQEAINSCKAFPDKPITIRIKNGEYHEKVKVHAWNTRLSLIGEGRAKTIITFGDYFGKIDKGRNSTFMTYTLMVDADDFNAENLTIENSAGPVGQAVALHVEGNRCSFINCSFLGNQDTLYAAGENSRQYFDNCYIEGTTDFIFGAATVVFEDCEIHSKANSYITAASTPDGVQNGFVFIDCKMTAAAGLAKVYLGRPWRRFAKTVFIRCEMGQQIIPEGWNNWDNKEAEKTVLYAEYMSLGPGANPAQRVSWSRQLSGQEANNYSAEVVLGDWVQRMVHQ